MADLFADLLPPLSSEEFDALRADIKSHGVLQPVFVDENGDVLDGRHRLKIDKNAPRKVISGLSPAEKEAFVFRCNFVRRNLSPDQKREARQKMKATAERLRTEDAKKWTQAKVAEALGVDRTTVAKWFPDTTNVKSHNGGTSPSPRPDARVKVDGGAKRVIAERVESGEAQAKVAADFGISQQAASKIVNAKLFD